MRKRLLHVADKFAASAGKAVRHGEGLLGAGAAVVGTVELTGRPGAGWLVAAAFLLTRDLTK